MNPVPASPPSPSIVEYFYQIGSLGYLFVIVAIILGTWLFYLTFRLRPLSDYFAFLIATFYPTCLGLLGASLATIQIFHELGNNGIANPDPQGLAMAIGETLLRLIVGTAMTCFLMPAGLLVILIRKPK